MTKRAIARWRHAQQVRVLLSAEASPANTTSLAASAVGGGLAVVGVTPPWPRSHCFHNARMDKTLIRWFS